MSKYFSRNGQLLPNDQAVVSLDDIAYAYGYGVYETIRVVHGVPYFVQDHIDRLMNSAAIIELEHPFDPPFVLKSIRELIKQGEIDTSNLKILLIGGRMREDAALYIQSHSPLFPDRKLYKTGVHTITQHYERLFPQAKTLNMLPSYLLYKKAIAAGAYDALLINHDECITEGTRTNFFALKGRTLVSPPEHEVLSGVMRKAVLQVARQNEFEIIEQPIPLASISGYDAAFITSTSTKIMPIHTIDDYTFGERLLALRDLMTAFDDFYKSCNGKL